MKQSSKITRLFICVILNCIGLNIQAQNARLETRQFVGFIIPHRVGVDNLIKGHVKAYEVSAESNTTGHKYWQQAWGYPRVGGAFYFADLANPDQLGYSLAVFPYIKFDPVSEKRLRINIRVGGGLGYITKVFDDHDNYKNVLVGSHFNVIANLVGEVEYSITDRFNAGLGLGFMHYSNGAFKVPNLGINIPSVNAALSYSIGEPKPKVKLDTVPYLKNYQAIAIGTFGLKENYPIGAQKFPVYGLNIELSRMLGHRGKVTGTFDFFYNTSLGERLDADSIAHKGPLDISQQGIMLGYGVVVDRLSMQVGQGYYLRTKYKGDTQFYHRLGVTYLLTKRIALRWMLKTHFFKADSFEFGIGYRFL